LIRLVINFENHNPVQSATCAPKETQHVILHSTYRKFIFKG